MIQPQKCPICDSPVAAVEEGAANFPFCSQRCRQIDLLRWCEGRYAIVEPLTPRELQEELWRLEEQENG